MVTEILSDSPRSLRARLGRNQMPLLSTVNCSFLALRQILFPCPAHRSIFHVHQLTDQFFLSSAVDSLPCPARSQIKFSCPAPPESLSMSKSLPDRLVLFSTTRVSLHVQLAARFAVKVQLTVRSWKISCTCAIDDGHKRDDQSQ